MMAIFYLKKKTFKYREEENKYYKIICTYHKLKIRLYNHLMLFLPCQTDRASFLNTNIFKVCSIHNIFLKTNYFFNDLLGMICDLILNSTDIKINYLRVDRIKQNHRSKS